MPLCLADNDILSRAAHWGLLADVPHLGTVSGWPEVAVLDGLVYRAGKAAGGKSDRLFRDMAAAAHLHQVLQGACALPLVPMAELTRLASSPAIDDGEARLLGALLATPGATWITGDHRALRALPDVLSPGELSSLAGRVKTTEHLVQEAIRRHGLATARALIAPHAAMDTNTRIALGIASQPDQANVEAALNSTWTALQSSCGGVLAPL